MFHYKKLDSFMKKLLFLTALIIAAMPVLAGNVDLSTAQSKATAFLRTKAFNSRLMTSAPTVKWTHEVKNSSNAAQAAYYIVNTDQGYVIVSGDDRAKDILAYGDGSLESINDLPDAVQYFLDIYQKQMEYLQAHPAMVVQKRSFNRGISVDPMLQTTWAQDKPYNMRCPKVGRDYCKVGCTAVALAQVIRYWEYPATAPAMEAYTSPKTGITASALPGCTFDWANMRNTYEGLSESYIDNNLPEYEIDAIGNLMRYVGQAEKVDYNVNQTGTQNLGILGAIQLFGFDAGAHIVKKCDSPDTEEELAAGDYTEEEYYNDEQWGQAIQAELRAGRPLVYCAYDMSSDSTGIAGHAFNVDGYDADNDTYHVNFGMKSEKNGYFALNAFQVDFVTIYDFWPIFFAGVQPPGMTTEPRILVSPQELTMECYVGETTTATFNVVGERLSGNITVTVTDENGVFTADAATIAVEDSAANATVTVTYAPQAVGAHNATITLSSEGAENKVVTLSGTATNAPLEVYTPVMQPADSNYIRLTSFRADWTDQTIAENVASYTLEVSAKPAGPSAGDLIAEADWSDLPYGGDVTSHANDYLPQGWGCRLSGMYLDGGCISIDTGDYINTNTLDLTGFDKVTVVIVGKDYNPNYKHSGVTISTSIDQEYVQFTSSFEPHTVVLDCTESEQIKFTADYYPEIQSIRIYAGEVTAPQMRATETGNETYRLITGITSKFYTVENLAEAGTFLYKVKAIYTDGTESVWSNIEEVTLFDNGSAPHGFDPGDVNHDGDVTIKDVTALIDYLLGASSDICTTCADVSGDSEVTIKDVTSLIDMLLGSGN